jgi:hypothetical protein
MTTTPVEEEFRQFIEFGHVFDKATRRYLAHYLKNKLYGKPTDRPHRYDSPQYDYLKETLDRIFADDRLLRISAGNEALANQIVHDTLAWMRKSQQEVNRDNPVQAEFSRLNSWKDRPLELLPDTWYHLTNFLQENYSPEQIDVRFYVERFDPIFRHKDKFLAQLKALPDEKLPVEILMDDLLVQWERLLVAKSLEYEFKELENRAKAYADLLYAKADEYEKMMDLGGALRRGSRPVLGPLAGPLATNQLRRAEQVRRAAAKRKVDPGAGRPAGPAPGGADRNGRGKVRIRHCQGLVPRPVPRNAAKSAGCTKATTSTTCCPPRRPCWADPLTENAFYKRYADKHLLTFRFQGKEVVRGQGSATATREKTRRKEKGPFHPLHRRQRLDGGHARTRRQVLCFAI